MQTFLIILSIVLLLCCAWILLAAPGGRRKRTRGFAKVKYAHRGLHGAGRAENSLSAFRAAANEGFGIELDVRLSKDGVPVVFHDAELSRVTGDCRRVRDLTAKELSELSLSGTAEGIPTFREVLDTVAGRVPILVEIKEDNAKEKDVTPAALALLADYRGEYLIEGFNPFSISAVKKLAPDTVRGLLCQHFTAEKSFRTISYRLLQHFLLNVLCRPQFIAFNREHRNYFPFRLQKAVFRVPAFAWTVRSAEEEAECVAAGFDTVIFENYLPDGGRVSGAGEKKDVL